MSERVQVFPFINRFVEPPRLEVVIDWRDDWPDQDPFAGAEFKLAHGNEVYDTPLTEIVIPEVREQLIVVGHDAASDAQRIANIPLLATDYVRNTASLITGPVVTFGAFAATSMSELGKPQLFGGENLLADLERWVTEPTPDERADRVVSRPNNAPPSPPPDEMRNSVNTLLRGTGRPLAAAFTTAAAAAQGPNPNEVVRNPQQFRALIRDANAAGMGQQVKDLASVIRRRAVAEQLLYAEALRRDQYYSRIRGEDKPAEFRTMTATTDPLKQRRDRRADIRRISRDEPVVGAMFFVLRWFELPKYIDDWRGQDIRVLPFRSGSSIDGFQARETRVGFDGTRTITILRRDGAADYFARTLFVRQLAPALLLENDEPSIEEMLTLNQACPRITTANAQNFMFAAEALNNHAHDPLRIERERDLITPDARREMRDAAESIRRNLPPYDAIGITWERTLVGQMIRGEMETPYHSGFKGYRIDVRETGGDASWKSLCTIEREVFDKNGEAVVRTRRPREGYVTQPVQNHSSDKAATPTVLTMPSDFVVWTGGSVVVPAPLDRVGEALAPPPADGPLISMREIGATKIHPRFGREYEFRVRGVGLSGVGPDASFDSTTAARDSVMFKRGVLMDAPRAEAKYVDLVPVDENCEALDPQKATPDALLFAKSRDARIEIDTSLPLAHWRVALHARGVSAAEVTEQGGARLENACARYVARTRENWRRRLAGIRDAENLKPAAFLNAVDPHCGAVELVTKAWFPFSTNPNKDRYIVVGSEEHKRRDIREATFSELVAMGEEIIDTERLDDHFTIHINDDTLPANDTPQRPPRMLAGFRGRAELSAKWSPDAITHFTDGEGRRRWTRELFGGLPEARAIGGRVAAFDQTFDAGGPPLSSGDIFIDAAYSAIEDVEKERDLILPQPPPPTGPSCEVSQAPPTRADAVRWRKKFFEDDCSAQPATPACLTQRAIYRAFVAQQLGAVDLSSLPAPTPEDVELHKLYRNQLAVVLKPMLVPNTKKSLVVPVFTFPDETSYAQDVDLGPTLGNTRSVIAKIGEFGSAGVISVNVTAGGDLYDKDNPPEVVFTRGDGSGARGTAVIENAAIKGVTIIDGGHDYDTAPEVHFQTTRGSGAVATATIGPSQPRKLPWVDSDVIWSVRIGWRVPLRGSRIERPLELAAVREFRLFRSERDECGNEVKKRMATIRRPGSDTLESIDLDQVEFAWIDGITDRDRHEFTYSITAVPEDCNTFQEQEWYSLNVNVPDSRIAARPESTRYLPMLAKQDGGGTTRSLAVYFSDAAVRTDADRVSYFFARAADDPMLSITPVAKVDGGRIPFIPSRWEQVFPANRVSVQRVKELRDVASVRGNLDGIFAGMLECGDVENRRSRVFVVSSKDGSKPLVKPTAASEIGNPFFKLHLHTYDSKRFPALAHTSASEPAESDWLQFYPDDLRWSLDPKLELLAPWGDGSQTDANHIWYRFHFFAQATESLSFHVSTFYSPAPELPFDTARRNAVIASFRRFAGSVPSCLRLFVRAEEGLLAESYAIKEITPIVSPDKQSLKVDPALTPVHFVVLRSTPEAKEVQIGCTTPPT